MTDIWESPIYAVYRLVRTLEKLKLADEECIGWIMEQMQVAADREIEEYEQHYEPEHTI